MALDKVVDSAVLDADLFTVANAIRTKGGTSGELAFPKGFVDAIEAISAGGGGGLSVLSGEFTPAENILTATVDVGAPFDRFLIVPDAELVALGLGIKTFFLFYYDRTKTDPYRLIYCGNAGYTGNAPTFYANKTITQGYEPTVSETQIAFKNGTAAATLGYFIAGVTYRWLAW